MADVRLIYGEHGDARRYRVEPLGVYRREPMPFWPIWVRVTPHELEHAAQHARKIDAINRASGLCNRNRYDRRRPEVDVYAESYTAELAFARHFGGEWDDTLAFRSHGVDVWINGVAYDVKSTWLVGGRLLVGERNPDVDRYALVILHKLPASPGISFIDIRGFAEQGEVVRPENIKDLGRGPGYVLPQSALHDFADA